MRILSVISGKGGVGKTTLSAGIASLLASKGRKTLLLDMDAGMGNSEIVLGVEGHQPMQFSPDIVSVIEKGASLGDVILSDRQHDFLYYSTLSHGTIKTPIHPSRLNPVLASLEQRGFEFLVIDAPAGAGPETLLSMALATELIFVTTCDRSSMVDADRLLAMLRRGEHTDHWGEYVPSDSAGLPAPSEVNRKALETGLVPSNSFQSRANGKSNSVDSFLIINRYSAKKAERRIIPNFEDVQGFLRLPLLGVIPECDSVIASANRAERFTSSKNSASSATDDIVNRILGRNIPMRVEFEPKTEKPKAPVNGSGAASPEVTPEPDRDELEPDPESQEVEQEKRQSRFRFMNWNWLWSRS